MAQLLSHDGLQSVNIDTATVSSIIGSTPPDGDIEFQGNIVADGEIRFVETGDDRTEYVALKAVDTVPANVTFCLPSADGGANSALVTDGTGKLSFSAAAVGDVSGGPFSDDKRLLRTDTVAGTKSVQQSSVTLDDSGNLTNVLSIELGSTNTTTLTSTANIASYTLNYPEDVPGSDGSIMVWQTGGASSSFAVRVDGGVWSNDNRVLRTDTASTKDIQESGLVIDDLDVLSGANGLSFSGTSQMLLETSQASSSAIKLNALGVLAGIDMDATNINMNATGSQDASILLNSTGGGIDLEAGSGHTLELDGGQIKIKSKDNTAKAIELLANQGTSETIEIINTQGTSDSAVLIQAAAGKIDLNGVLIDSSANIEAFNLTLKNILALQDIGAGTEVIKFRAPTPLTSTYTVIYPDDVGITGQVMVSDVSGSVATLSWDTSPSPPGYVDECEAEYTTVTTITVTAGTVRSDDNTFDLVLSAPQATVITTAGAGGLDTGSEASDTWYSVWVIGDSVAPHLTTTTLFSVSETAPTLPAGYDTKRRVGWTRNNGSSDFLQYSTGGKGRDRHVAWEVERTETSVLTNNGTNGSVTFTVVDCSDAVPPSTKRADFQYSFDLDSDGDTLFVRSGLNSFATILNTPIILGPGTETPFALNTQSSLTSLSLDPSGPDFEYATTDSGNGTGFDVLSYYDYI